MDELIELLEGFGTPRVALVGDFMLDRYVYGDAERVSPEAPVPVLKVVRQESRTGGAGNVASAILALGGQVACIGVMGKDAPGNELVRMLNSAGAETASLLRLANRSTSVKTRYVGLAQHKNPQQMIRVDSENTEPVSKKVQNAIKAAVRNELKECQVLAVEDYDKGLLGDETVQIIAEARSAGVPIVVDPARINDYRRYRGATLLTPNRFEASLASGIEITDAKSLQRAAEQVLMIAEAEAVIVTLDKEGVFLLRRGEEGRKIPARPRSIYDVTGAGDIVLAALAVALAEKCSFENAAMLANEAGGLEVERFGVVPIMRQEIIDEMRRTLGLRSGKIMLRPRLTEEVARRRQKGETIVFTNGCFDLLHMGHVRHLQEARKLGSCLIVAINSDESIRRLKGPGRPVIGQDERAEVLGALECVDYVTIFDEDTPIPLLEQLRPELLVKGGTTPEVVGQEVVEGYDGKVITLGLVEGLSTTEIINRIVSASDES